MAPEQLQAGVPDARSDLYSLGVTFYEAVTGRCPFEGTTEFEIMNAHLNVLPPSPVEWNPSLPPILSAIILRSLGKRPADRFQTAADFLYALQPVAFGPQPWLPPNSLTPTATLLEVKPDSASRPAVPAATPLPFDQATLDAATKELATYIGPIAKIIVNRAARRGGSRRQFYEALAEEISTPADRARFLTKLSR
jgi:serine/threonine-protein kinase